VRVGDQELRLGPDFPERGPKPGGCPECGGQCSPECGLHPKGCIFGGLGAGYWMIADGCDLDHGEE
jgi:hypothetical protein